MTDRGLTAYLAAKTAGIGRLSGTVLEIGAGRGRNFEHLRAGVRWIGAEPDAPRRAVLARTAREHGHGEAPLDAPAESLPLADDSVDGVLSTGVLCSVRDQDRALAEIARVLRPGADSSSPSTWRLRAAGSGPCSGWRRRSPAASTTVATRRARPRRRCAAPR